MNVDDCNLNINLEDLYHSAPTVDADEFKYSEL